MIVLCMEASDTVSSIKSRFKLKHLSPHGGTGCRVLGDKLNKYRKVFHQLNFTSKQDIVNFFSNQELIRVVKVDDRKFKFPFEDKKSVINKIKMANSSVNNTSMRNNGLSSGVENSSIKEVEVDKDITFKKMGTTNSTGRSKLAEERKHDNDSHDHSHGGTVNDHEDASRPKLSYIPMKTVIEELQSIKKKMNSLQPGTMEYLFMDLEYKMKSDNLKILERVNAVSLNTAMTKLVCEQTRVDNEELTKSLEGTQAVQDQHQVTMNIHLKDIQSIYDKISFLEGIVEKQAQEIVLLKQANEDQIA